MLAPRRSRCWRLTRANSCQKKPRPMRKWLASVDNNSSAILQVSERLISTTTTSTNFEQNKISAQEKQVSRPTSYQTTAAIGSTYSFTWFQLHMAQQSSSCWWTQSWHFLCSMCHRNSRSTTQKTRKASLGSCWFQSPGFATQRLSLSSTNKSKSETLHSIPIGMLQCVLRLASPCSRCLFRKSWRRLSSIWVILLCDFTTEEGDSVCSRKRTQNIGMRTTVMRPIRGKPLKMR